MISVIVPIYMVEKYLERCIESIIGQTYSNLEIILVNDGSPDNCGQICEEYVQKDERIKVIHKENGGLSDARNAGLMLAQGDFITFVDSDDYISPNMLEFLLKKIKQYDADISACLLQKFYEDLPLVNLNPVAEDDVLLSGIEGMAALFTMKEYITVTAHCKLYKSRLFKDTGILFPVARQHEDNFTTYKLFHHAQRIVCSNQKYYYYLQRADSIMGKQFNLKRLDGIAAAEQALDYVKHKKLLLLEQVYCNYILAHLIVTHIILQENDWKQWRYLIKELKEKIFKSAPRAITNRYLHPRHRFALIVLRISCWCYAIAIRCLHKINLMFGREIRQ